MATQHHLTLNEIDPTSGQIKRSYVLSRTNTGLLADDAKQQARLDAILPNADTTTSSSSQLNTRRPSTSNLVSRLLNNYFHFHTVLEYLKSLFLPTGYPHTVTADYTPYQIYDSLQAFASTIAGLLSSRAVLQSLNIVSSTSLGASDDAITPDSTSAATAATLLSILQSTLGNLTSILFASHAAPRVSTDVRFYRFLADIANDAAFVLDLLAPSLPSSFSLVFGYIPFFQFLSSNSRYMALLQFHRFEVLTPFVPSPKVVVLCTSSMLRAVCGVAGGSSKAVLSAHFARNNPESVGDLNAKDGSQETVVNLLGMWIGGLVVSRVEGVGATWMCMVVLLGIHLWANYRAAKSVRLKGLNRERAGRVLMQIVDGVDQCWDELGVDVIGGKEGVLGLRRLVKEWLGRLHGQDGRASWRRWRVGVSVEEFLGAMSYSGRQSEQKNSSKSLGETLSVDQLIILVALFERERYLLWVGEGGKGTVIALKKDARPIDQLRAWYHAFLAEKLHQQSRRGNLERLVPDLLFESLKEVRRSWEDVCGKLEFAGWDLSSTNLEDEQGARIELH